MTPSTTQCIYTQGSQEVIDTIEEAISNAPNGQEAFLQGQVLKYMLRMWLKENPLQDCREGSMVFGSAYHQASKRPIGR